MAKIHGLCQEGIIPKDLDTSKVSVDQPKDLSHGDLTTNAAMVLSKQVGMSPRQLSEKLIETLKEIPEVESVEIAGPGFINIRLKESYLRQHLQSILLLKDDYGRSSLGKGKKALVEFVSVNPTGPLHIGHGRNAVLGDAISSLLQHIGYEVTKEYYVNDAGGQVNELARSLYLRYVQLLGDPITEADFTNDMYLGDYLVPIAKKLCDTVGDKYHKKSEEFWLSDLRRFAVVEMMEIIKQDLADLGVVIDLYTSEEALVNDGMVEKVLSFLEKKGDIYQGVLTPPKGHVIDDWEPRSQTLFRATLYGDDTDRALKKSDGSWTYFAGDIAYHFHKLNRKYDLMINVFGADHAGYLKRLYAAVNGLSKGCVEFEIVVNQMVNFMENGTPIRMSKRSGNFVRIKDVIDRVGQDVARLMMLTRQQDMPIDFDFAKVIDQSKDNPVFYIQYAHARIQSVFRQAAQHFDLTEIDWARVDLEPLTNEEELGIIKLLSLWPRTVETAALFREPHRVVYYLQDLAAAFHSLWNKGKENAELRFVEPQNKDRTLARLALLHGISLVIRTALGIFKITAVNEM